MEGSKVFEDQLAEMRHSNHQVKLQLERATIEQQKSRAKLESVEARN